MAVSSEDVDALRYELRLRQLHARQLRALVSRIETAPTASETHAGHLGELARAKAQLAEAETALSSAQIALIEAEVDASA